MPHQAENSTEDLLADLTSIVYSFCARVYGQRRAKRKTSVLCRNWRVMVKRVEKHVIARSDPRYAALDAACFASKNLYNAALYEMRQAFIFGGCSLTYHAMDRRMQSHEA